MQNHYTAPRIMLVDDEESVLLALTLLLQALGYQAKGYTRGQEALEVLTQDTKAYDLLLCDLRMPEMNGLEVIAQAMKLAPGLKIVLMSAHATQEELDQAQQVGVTQFLGKPFTAEQLREVVSRNECAINQAH